MNYTVASATNTAGTYTDLGSAGTAITTTSTDDANSAAQNIGFTFNYNGTAFTQFVLNTNGVVRLGSAAPSTAALYYDNNTASTSTDPLQSNNAANTNLLMPFNTDLVPGSGTGGAEYRVATTGTAGSRVCTIQWKNVADKAGAGSDAANGTQFANISFQLKLYEGTGVIDFVYGPAVAGTAAAGQRFPNVGLKSGGLANAQLLLGLKSYTAAWSTTTFQNDNYTTNAHDINKTALPDAGRTYHFVPCSATPVVVAAFPYTENFDSLPVGTLPCGSQLLDANTDYSTWQVDTDPTGSPPNALVYVYSSTNAANDWFFTPALSLQAGTRYQLQFKYSADDSNYPEALEVKYGTAATAAGQTGSLFSNLSITNVAYATTTASQVAAITPATSGIYYIGFHGISQANQSALYVDDIQVTATPVLAVRNAANSVFTAQATPVPFGESLSLTLNTLKAGPLHLTMRDALGRVLRQSTTTAPAGTSTIAVPEVTNLPAGVYFLNIEQGGATQVLRVAHQ